MPANKDLPSRGPAHQGLAACSLETIEYTLVRVPWADSGERLGYRLKVAGAARLVFPGDTPVVMPFSTAKTFQLVTPPGVEISVHTLSSQCQVFPANGSWQVGIKIATLVQALAQVCLVMPALPCGGKKMIPEKIQTAVVFSSCILKTLLCLGCAPESLAGEVYQYNALAGEGQSIYTNADEIPEFGSQGILDPTTVSWVELFINGVLQPPATYNLTTGQLTLISDDLPLAGSPIILRFISIKGQGGLALPASDYQYCTIADGSKLVFSNSDELPYYGNQGIPDPAAVSYFNLYINGVLQPHTNYQVGPGVLTLKTEAPRAGAPIILQGITVPGNGGPLPAAVSIFASRVNGSHYTTADGIAAYDSSPLIDPSSVSFVTLTINGVGQPAATYSLAPGQLDLLGVPLPRPGGPITLQYVRIMAQDCLEGTAK